MILDFYVEFENREEHIEELEEKLLKKQNEIQEDLSIRIYLSVKVDNEYENFEIEHYLEENDDIEDEIYKVIDIVTNKIKRLEAI